MELRPITNEQDYQAALRHVEPMFDCEPPLNTPEGNIFEELCQLIADYEKNIIPKAQEQE